MQAFLQTMRTPYGVLTHNRSNVHSISLAYVAYDAKAIKKKKRKRRVWKQLSVNIQLEDIILAANYKMGDTRSPVRAAAAPFLRAHPQQSPPLMNIWPAPTEAAT